MNAALPATTVTSMISTTNERPKSVCMKPSSEPSSPLGSSPVEDDERPVELVPLLLSWWLEEVAEVGGEGGDEDVTGGGGVVEDEEETGGAGPVEDDDEDESASSDASDSGAAAGAAVDIIGKLSVRRTSEAASRRRREYARMVLCSCSGGAEPKSWRADERVLGSSLEAVVWWRRL